jgi:hypothetical protein
MVLRYGGQRRFDVVTNDTLSLKQMLLFYGGCGIMLSSTALVKTVRARSRFAPGLKRQRRPCIPGPTVLRNGSLVLSEDDYGKLSGTNTFNGRNYSGYGGSLGYSAFTNTVTIGDDGTADTDNLALIANGDGRWIGHNMEVFNKGASVTFGMTTGTVMFANTITLHSDIAFSGPTNGVMAISNIVAAADYTVQGHRHRRPSGLRIEARS